MMDGDRLERMIYHLAAHSYLGKVMEAKLLKHGSNRVAQGDYFTPKLLYEG